MGCQYQASTRLRYQSFDIRLEDEPRVGTPIRQRLLPTLALSCIPQTFCCGNQQDREILNQNVTPPAAAMGLNHELAYKIKTAILQKNNHRKTAFDLDSNFPSLY